MITKRIVSEVRGWRSVCSARLAAIFGGQPTGEQHNAFNRATLAAIQRYHSSPIDAASVANLADPPRESIPARRRDFGLAWSVSAGISGVYRTQHTQLATSSKSPFPAGSSVRSMTSFSGPPFTSAEGGTKGFMGFGSAAAMQCAARPALPVPA